MELIGFSTKNVSSENKKYPAENLLKQDETCWKCRRWQEYAWIVCELDQECVIDSVQIYNSGSAFVEIFVSKFSDFDYKVLVPVFNCMSPKNSRDNIDCNQKFTFKSNDFTPTTRDHSWKFIKLVSSQWFNKSTKFGLSQLKVYGHKNDATKSNGKHKFKIKNDFDNTWNIAMFDLNYKKSLSKKCEPKKTAFSSNIEQKMEVEQTILLDAAMNMNGNRDNDDNNKAKHIAQNGNGRSEANIVSTVVGDKPGCSYHNSQLASPASTSHSHKVIKNKTKKLESKKEQKSKRKAPFDRLMSHVVYVLSGYENPLRSNLRDKANAMGAQYSAKWDSNCTHLICAFANTPKYNEVRRLNGRIVSEKWIEDSYSSKKLLEWRNFMIGTYNGPDTPPSSDADDTDLAAVDPKPPPNEMNSHYDSDIIYDLDTEEDDNLDD